MFKAGIFTYADMPNWKLKICNGYPTTKINIAHMWTVFLH